MRARLAKSTANCDGGFCVDRIVASVAIETTSAEFQSASAISQDSRPPPVASTAIGQTIIAAVSSGTPPRPIKKYVLNFPRCGGIRVIK